MASTQSFEPSVRPVFFETGIEEFFYATHGGTLFLVEYLGKPYAITCDHVFKDFEPGRLVVGQDQVPKGCKAANVKGRYRPADPTGAAVDSDVLDIAILDFFDGITPEFFRGSAFVLNDETAGSSEKGHFLQVYGTLKSQTKIEPPDIAWSFGHMDFHDRGESNADAVLRVGECRWVESTIDNITGISGAPVMDRTTGKLCGMVARGTVENGTAIIHFIDIFDILQFLRSSIVGGGHAHYTRPVREKHVYRPGLK
jgi:hypothetical protein